MTSNFSFNEEAVSLRTFSVLTLRKGFKKTDGWQQLSFTPRVVWKQETVMHP
jgi:hypothetical protein